MYSVCCQFSCTCINIPSRPWLAKNRLRVCCLILPKIKFIESSVYLPHPHYHHQYFINVHCLSVCLSFSLSLLFIWAVCACSDNVQSVTLDVTSLFILMQCLSPSISLKPRRSKGRNYCVADPLLPWSIAARLCEPEVCCLSCIYTSSVVCLLYRGLLSALPLHLFCCLPSLQRFAVCLDFTPFLLSAFLPEVCCLPCLYTSCVVCLLYRSVLSAMLWHLFCFLPSW